MKSWAKADLAAFSISVFEAPGLPLAIFSVMVPVKSTGSWKKAKKKKRKKNGNRFFGSTTSPAKWFTKIFA